MAQQLGFTLANAAGNAVLYIGSDATLNTLTLTITNTTASALTLMGGAPIPDPAGGVIASPQAALYLSIGGLLDADQFRNMRLNAAGWQATCYPGAFPIWGLSPAQTVELAPQGTIVITITNIIISVQPRPGSLTVDYYNLGTVPNDSAQLAFTVQNPPTLHRQLALNHGFAIDSTVDISTAGQPAIANTLTFYLSNTSPTLPLVPAGMQWGTNRPEFYLFFTYGDAPGYTALCTLDQAKNIAVAQSVVDADTWLPAQNTQGPAPYWALTPQNPEVLAAGGSVIFDITNIVTYLESGPTLMFIQYANIPGYDDGVMAVDIFKQAPPPTIVSLAAAPPSVNIGDSIELSWQTYGGDFCMIEELGVTVDPTGTMSVPVTSGAATSMHFTILCAKGTAAAPVNPVTSACHVRVNPTVIHVFDVSATEVALYGMVKITWSVASAASVTLMVGDTAMDVGLWGTMSLRIAVDTMFELIVVGTTSLQRSHTVTVGTVTLGAFTGTWTPDALQPLLYKTAEPWIQHNYPSWDGKWTPAMLSVLKMLQPAFRAQYVLGTLALQWDVHFASFIKIMWGNLQANGVVYQGMPVADAPTSMVTDNSGSITYDTPDGGRIFTIACYGRGTMKLAEATITEVWPEATDAPADASAAMVEEMFVALSELTGHIGAMPVKP